MKGMLKYTSRWTKLSLILVSAFSVFGAYCFITAIWGNPSASIASRLVLGLFGVAFCQFALHLWIREVVPGAFLAMCATARSLGIEEPFVHAVSPICGESPDRTAQRIGLRGLLKAFQAAQA